MSTGCKGRERKRERRYKGVRLIARKEKGKSAGMRFDLHKQLPCWPVARNLHYLTTYRAQCDVDPSVVSALEGKQLASTNVLSFEYRSGHRVTILGSKRGGRFRVQATSFEGLWLATSELVARVERLERAKARGGSGGDDREKKRSESGSGDEGKETDTSRVRRCASFFARVVLLTHISLSMSEWRCNRVQGQAPVSRCL